MDEMREGEMDQELAKMRDFIPGLWFAMYQGCLDKGFDKYQSMGLLQTWILAQNPNGIQPPKGEGPESDKE